MNIQFSVRIETLGCRLNQVESEALAVRFAEAGFKIFSKDVAFSDKNRVKLCFINTCTVTGKAEQKARRLIRLLLKTHTEAVVVVTGCYAELEAEFIESISPRVEAFSGKRKDELYTIPEFLKESLALTDFYDTESIKKIISEFKTKVYAKKDFKFSSSKMFKLSSPVFMFHSRASLKVQDGCNNACSYCRIRLARGGSISLPAEEAVNRLRQIEKNGAGEVVLSGVNLSQYFDEKIGGFANLLSLLLKESGHIRIRISSLYPETIDEAILPVLRNGRICPHFHLSIQSGSDKILKAMNRQYCREDIFKAVNRLREVKDKPFIGCDIITGFPSETEEDFEETFSLCKDLKIPGVHVFPFSARPGTGAFLMKSKIPEREAGLRAEKLSALSEKNYTEYLKACNGKVFFAVVEKPVKAKPPEVVTENYLSLPLKIDFFADKYKGGEGVFVKINGNTAELLP